MAISATAMGGVWGQVHRTPEFFLVACATAMAGAFAVGARRATRGVLSPARKDGQPLQPALLTRIDALVQVVPSLTEERHRQALRGVVQRALGLRRALPPKEAVLLDDELAQALDQALVAAGRMDQIDKEIGAESLIGKDLNQAGPEARRLLLERDTWSSRLLDLSALLETLRVRLVAVRADAGPGREDREEALSDLRARVAAEEVERI